jgi:hypothetical protein
LCCRQLIQIACNRQGYGVGLDQSWGSDDRRRQTRRIHPVGANDRLGSTIAASLYPLNGGFRFLSPENCHSAIGQLRPFCFAPIAAGLGQ